MGIAKFIFYIGKKSRISRILQTGYYDNLCNCNCIKYWCIKVYFYSVLFYTGKLPKRYYSLLWLFLYNNRLDWVSFPNAKIWRNKQSCISNFCNRAGNSVPFLLCHNRRERGWHGLFDPRCLSICHASSLSSFDSKRYV